MPYPERLGVWPAAAALLIFTWIELASGWGEHPARLAAADARLLASCTWAGDGATTASRPGPAAARPSASTSTCSAASRSSRRAARGRACGRCCAACRRSSASPGIVGFVVRDDRHRHLRRPQPGRVLEEPLRRRGRASLADTIGLLLGVALVAGFYRLGMAGPGPSAAASTPSTLARAFVHSLVPIAAVYVAAHYLTFLIFEGQAIRYTAADPFGQGWDLLRLGEQPASTTASSRRTPPGTCRSGWSCPGTSPRSCWRTTARSTLYGQPRLAVRSQYWMLGIMIGFTTLALWLLAQAGSHEAARRARAARARARGLRRRASRRRRRARPRPRSPRLVDFSKKPPYVNTLDIDPPTKDFLLTTNRGFWRIAPGRHARSRQVKGTITAAGKTVDRRARSSRSAPPARAAARLAATRTSRARCRTSSACCARRRRRQDLVGGRPARRRRPAQDHPAPRPASTRSTRSSSAMLISERRRQDVHGGVHAARADHRLRGRPGRTRSASSPRPRPSSSAPRTAAARGGPLTPAKGIRLAWPEPEALYRADADGTIKTLRGRRDALEGRRRVGGEPYELHATGPKALFLVLSDGSILETTDGGATWRDRFRP